MYLSRPTKPPLEVDFYALRSYKLYDMYGLCETYDSSATWTARQRQSGGQMFPNRKTINVSDLRAGMREILENAYFRGQHYVVERAGHSMVAILSVDEYERLMAGAVPSPAGDPTTLRSGDGKR